MAIREKIDNEGNKTFWVYVNLVSGNGKRIQKTRKGIATLKQAKKVEFELKRKISNDIGKHRYYTWNEWFNKCIEQMEVELKASTVIDYTSRNKIWISPFLKNKLLKDITPKDVHDVVYNPKFDVSWYTRRCTLKKVKRILAMAVEEGLLSHNPALKVKVKVPEARQMVLNQSEVKTLLNHAKANNHRFYEVWVMAVMTGMRSGELYALRWSDVDFDRNLISVSRSWSSKNGFGPTKTARNRVIPLSRELRKFLAELRQQTVAISEYVLPRLGEWTRGEQAKVLRDYCEGIGITSIRFHDLRATFITQMLSKGVSVATVMAIVGHSELKTTQGYLRLAGLDLQGSTDKLGISLPDDSYGQVISIAENGK